MYRLLPVCTVLLLSTIIYTGPVALGQSTPTSEARLLLDALRAEEAAAEAQAESWSGLGKMPGKVVGSDGRVSELIRMEDHRPIYLTAHNERAASATGTDALYAGRSLGLSLSGRGLRLGIWDAGVARETHNELSGRTVPKDAGPADDHATHVAGTLAGAGRNVRAQGMAYAATIHSYDWTGDLDEIAEEAEAGLLVSNHSYGPIAGWHYGDLEDQGDQWYWLGNTAIATSEDYAFGRYDGEAEQFDALAYAYPSFLPVISAGNDQGEAGPSSGAYRGLNRYGRFQDYNVNAQPHPADGGEDGFDTLAGAANAKNVLTIGSVGQTSSGRFRLSPFSSMGPTDDGRIKPDLVGYGEQVYSSIATHDAAYGRMSGTSMSSPNVAGTLLLLQEHALATRGEALSAAGLKGLAIHTANDLGTPGPDYAFGWGLLDAREAARHLSESTTSPVGIAEAILGPLPSYEQTLRHRQGGPIRVTLSWTDAPSTRLPVRAPSDLDNPSPHLRNDLDVRLVHLASGTSYAPYTLDPRTPAAPAWPGDNTVDPVEQIYLPDAPAGDYLLTVSHKGLRTSAQPFSLLVSGLEETAQPVLVAQLTLRPSIEVVSLQWETTQELRPGRFVLERAPLPNLGEEAQPISPFEFLASLEAAGQPERYRYADPDPIAGPFRYRIRFVSGARSYLVASQDTFVPAPSAFVALSNYPNPFNASTRLVIDVEEARRIRIEVFDLLGRRMLVAFDGDLPAGRHELALRTGTWPAGVYFARVTSGMEQRMLRLLKE